MRRLLSVLCVLGLLTLAGPLAPADARGPAPTVPPPGAAFDPGPLGDAALDLPAPPIPPGARSPLDDRGGASAESVIGPDDRTRVTATTEYPSSAIGQLTFTMHGSPFLCSGFLIDANTVLTAGHCVHEGGLGGVYAQNVVFTPGRNGDVAPFGSCSAVAVEASPGWLATGDEAEDYGWIELDCLIGHLVGWLGYSATGDVTGFDATVRGYPADRQSGTMWTDDGTIDIVAGGQAFYLMDTFGGQSGSPVYEPDLPACGGPCALAVHAYGLHGVGDHASHNHGTRLDEARAAAIALVAAADDRTDDEDPQIDIRVPADGAVFVQGQAPVADYGCTDGPTGSGIRSCDGPVADGEAIAMTLGDHEFRVRAEDGAGNVAEVTHRYRVVPPAPVAPAPPAPGPIAATPTFTG